MGEIDLEFTGARDPLLVRSPASIHWGELPLKCPQWLSCKFLSTLKMNNNLQAMS